LRALQEKTFNRLGGIQTLSSDFRFDNSHKRDLSCEVARGRFREDLYYRLNVVPITLPPLREREKDAVLLARHFINHYARKYNRQFSPLTAEDEKLISAYSWPGNIRELINIIERAVICHKEINVELNCLPGNQGFQPILSATDRHWMKFKRPI